MEKVNTACLASQLIAFDDQTTKSLLEKTGIIIEEKNMDYSEFISVFIRFYQFMTAKNPLEIANLITSEDLIHISESLPEISNVLNGYEGISFANFRKAFANTHYSKRRVL